MRIHELIYTPSGSPIWKYVYDTLAASIIMQGDSKKHTLVALVQFLHKCTNMPLNTKFLSVKSFMATVTTSRCHRGHKHKPHLLERQRISRSTQNQSAPVLPSALST